MYRDGDIVEYNGKLYKVIIYWEDMNSLDIKPISGGKTEFVYKSQVKPIDTFQQRYDKANKEFFKEVLKMLYSRYWFIEFESGEYAGAEFETAIDSQEVHDCILEKDGIEIVYCWPCHKWELYYSELDIY